MIRSLTFKFSFVNKLGMKSAEGHLQSHVGHSSVIFSMFSVFSVFFEPFFDVSRFIFTSTVVGFSVSLSSEMVKTETQYDATIQVEGGGLSAQAQATRLALAKALIEVLPNSRTLMKKQGFLTRDARIKERRKYGLKKARKAPQFSKR